MMKLLRLVFVALLGTIFYPVLIASQGKGKAERVALFFAGTIGLMLLFPVMYVITFWELKERSYASSKELFLASPFVMTYMMLQKRKGENVKSITT
ncbi:MAG: hypothetical protein QW085_07510 [Pyrobaculum sp.]